MLKLEYMNSVKKSLLFLTILFLAAACQKNPQQAAGNDLRVEPNRAPTNSVGQNRFTQPKAPPITLSQALISVSNIMDVKKFTDNSKAKGATPHVDSDGILQSDQQGKFWYVHIYEEVSDGNGESHIVTYAWFKAYDDGALFRDRTK